MPPARALPLAFLTATLALWMTVPVAATTRTASGRPAGTLAPGAYRWIGEGPWTGPIHMIISIDRQMIHVYSGDDLIGLASVSTGMKGHVTPKGDFPILQKRQFHRSNLYSNAPMPFMQRLTWDGIALHAGHNPGYPASHGCIRLPHAFAQRLFQITRIGTLTSVTADRLHPLLKVDALALSDPRATMVTFTPDMGTPAIARPAPEALRPPRDMGGNALMLAI
ncbi:MAG: L,D-transpeptidase family protein, partial [Sphingobium sp.]